MVGIFEDYLCSWLVSVVLVFVLSSSVVKPVSILVVVIPVLEVVISLIIPIILLVPSVSVVIAVEVLSVLIVFTWAPVIASEIIISVEEVQQLINEDADLVFDVLVAADYIDKIDCTDGNSQQIA